MFAEIEPPSLPPEKFGKFYSNCFGLFLTRVIGSVLNTFDAQAAGETTSSTISAWNNAKKGKAKQNCESCDRRHRHDTYPHC